MFIKNYLLWLALGVLALWFVLGFIFPLLIFRSVTVGGQFGDGFGAVNSLFTGIGFIAVSYTIYLQIESKSDQKEQETLALYIKLLDDLRADLAAVKWGTSSGPWVWSSLLSVIQRPDMLRKEYFGRIKPMISYLLGANTQVLYILKRLEKKDLRTSSSNLILAKLMLVYSSNIDEINTFIANFDKNVDDATWRLLKDKCDELMKRLDTVLPPFMHEVD